MKMFNVHIIVNDKRKTMAMQKTGASTRKFYAKNEIVNIEPSTFVYLSKVSRTGQVINEKMPQCTLSGR